MSSADKSLSEYDAIAKTVQFYIDGAKSARGNRPMAAAAGGFCVRWRARMADRLGAWRSSISRLAANISEAVRLMLKGVFLGHWTLQPAEQRKADIALAQRLAHEPEPLFEVAERYPPSRTSNAVAHVSQAGRAGVVLFDFARD